MNNIDEILKGMSSAESMGIPIDLNTNDPLNFEDKDMEILQVPTHIDASSSDHHMDYANSRAIQYSLMVKAGKTLEMALQSFKYNPDPKTLDSITRLIDSINKITKDIHNIHKDFNAVKKIQELDINASDSKAVATPALTFVGDSTSLKRAIERGEI
jgi:hypothetical protein